MPSLPYQEISTLYSTAVAWDGNCMGPFLFPFPLFCSSIFFFFCEVMRGIWLLKILLILITFRNKRAKPIMIDPGLYSLNKSEIWWVIKQRSLPTAFKLYTGLSRFLSLFVCYEKKLLELLFFFFLPFRRKLLGLDCIKIKRSGRGKFYVI